MAIIPKTIETLMDDIATELVANEATIDDWNDGSKIKIQSRGFARIVSDCWRALTEVQRDSNPATAVDLALDLLVNLFGVYRKLGFQAQGFAVAIPKSNSAPGITIAAGELLTFNSTVTFAATGGVTLGTPYAVFPIQCTVIGAKYNLSAGTALKPSRTAISDAYDVYVGVGLDSRNLPYGGLEDGQDKESDEPLRERFGDHLLSLTRGTWRAVYTAIATLSWVRSFSLIQYVPAVGFMTAFVDDGSSNVDLSANRKAELLSLAEEWKSGGIGFRAQAMQKIMADIEIDITINRTIDVSISSIETMVQAYLEEQLSLWGLGQQLYISRVEALTFDVKIDGVPVVVAAKVTTPAEEHLVILPQQVFRPLTVTVNAHL